MLQVLQGSPCLSLSLSRSLALAFSHIRLSAHRGIVSCRRGTLFGVQFDDSSPVIYKTETSVRQMLVCDGEPAQMKQLELGLGLCALHPSDNVRYLEFSPIPVWPLTFDVKHVSLVVDTLENVRACRSNLRRQALLDNPPPPLHAIDVEG